MLTRMSQSMAYFFAEKGFFKKEHINCYVYGFYYVISETIYWLLIALIALLTGRVVESAVYMFTFINMRHCSGGYHASTRAKCNIIFTITYLIFLAILHITPQNIYVPAIFIAETVSLMVLLIFSPIKPENKKCTDDEMKKYRLQVIAYSLLFSLSAYICGLLPLVFMKKVGFCITIAMISVALSVLVTLFKERGKIK